MKALAIPLLIFLTGTGAIVLLAHQRQAVQVDHHMRPVKPVLRPPTPGGEQAHPGRNNPGPSGGDFRSLDTINAAAKAVGCPTLEPGDPAGKLIDVAECLGAKAVARRANPGGTN